MFKTLTEDGWVYCIGVYWLHLTNTIERFMRGGDGAFISECYQQHFVLFMKSF